MMVLPLLFLGGFLPLGSVGSRSRGSELGALTDLVLGAAGLPAVCFFEGWLSAMLLLLMGGAEGGPMYCCLCS